MKRIFTLLFALLSFTLSFAQSTYYWAGNGNATQSITTGFFTASNWREEIAGVISNTPAATLVAGSTLKIVGVQLSITSNTQTTTQFNILISGGRRPGSLTNLNGELRLVDINFILQSACAPSSITLRSNSIAGTLYHGIVTLVDGGDIRITSLRTAPSWTANSAIANNSYVVNGGRLYQASANIVNSGVTGPTHTTGTVNNLTYRGLYNCSNALAMTDINKARGPQTNNGSTYAFSSQTGTLLATQGALPAAGASSSNAGFASTGQGALPLQLVGFSAQKGTGRVGLNWSTSQEVNTSHFEVEQSNNGVSWKTITIVAAKGNANSLQKYSAEDIAMYSSKVYYRLKMVDNDGKYEYSPVAMVTFGGKGRIFAYPNPATSFTMISSDNAITENVTVSIYNTTGVLVKQQVITNPGNNFRVGLETLKQGSYILKINQGTELLDVIKIQKN